MKIFPLFLCANIAARLVASCHLRDAWTFNTYITLHKIPLMNVHLFRMAIKHTYIEIENWVRVRDTHMIPDLSDFVFTAGTIWNGMRALCVKCVFLFLLCNDEMWPICLYYSCATAYILLAEEEATTIVEAEKLFKQALKIGENCYRRTQQLQHHGSQYETQHREYTHNTMSMAFNQKAHRAVDEIIILLEYIWFLKSAWSRSSNCFFFHVVMYTWVKQLLKWGTWFH